MADVTAVLTEERRLLALGRMVLLDTLPEAAFDRLTRLAARLLGVPVALVTLVDADRQFFKSWRSPTSAPSRTRGSRCSPRASPSDRSARSTTTRASGPRTPSR